MKPSKFKCDIGAITDWQNSFQSYEQRINFLTERFQILRFENHACNWTLFDLPYVERQVNRDTEFGDDFADNQGNFKTGMSSDDY